ncbi:MAG TPA: type II toxin-antitoxin system prevent-host-death family antitoxin [Candidatus Limnocylindrales bacterium]|jgi:prevent-host-death family protein
MAEVTIRDLRNHGGDVVDRVLAGEEITVTRDGRPVAVLVAAPRRPVPIDALLARWRRLRAVDPVVLRDDIDELFDTSL